MTVERGIELANSGKELEAIEKWREAVKTDADNADGWELLAEYGFKNRRWREADRAYRNVLRLKPNAEGVNGKLAACLVREGDLDEAYNYVNRELKESPDDPPALLLKARIARGKNLNDERMDALQRIYRLQPDSPDVLSELAIAYMDGRQSFKARPLLERLTELQPSNSRAHARLGVVLAEMATSAQQLEDSRRHLETAVSLSPDYAYAHAQLGRLLMKGRRWPEAIEHLERASRLLPSKTEIVAHLVQAYGRAGQAARLQQARKRLAALQADENALNRRIMNNLAEPDRFDKQMEIALDLFERKDVRRARYYLTRALKLRQDDPQAKALLEQLQGLDEERDEEPGGK